MAVPAPPMSRATSSQHPATTASATADGAVAGGDALPGDDDAPDAPRQEAEEAVVDATDRAEGVVEASEAALPPPAPQPPAGHADLLVAMLTGALRAVTGGGHMHYHVKPAGMMSCSSCQSLSAELSEFLLYTWAEHFMTANVRAFVSDPGTAAYSHARRGVLLGSRHSLHNLPRRPGGCV
eukprot:jgi/Tetstr1/455955/TSEL_042736.t1